MLLGIEVVPSNADIVIPQRKYALQIMQEIDMLECKHFDTPLYSNIKHLP